MQTQSTSGPTCPSDSDPGSTSRNYGNYAYDASGNQSYNVNLGTLSYNTPSMMTASNPGTATNYTYAGANQSERVVAGPATFQNGLLGEQSRYRSDTGTLNVIRDPQGNLIGATLYNTSGTQTGAYYYAFDGHGSVVGLINSSGTETAKYRYDPYGNSTYADTVPAGGTLPNNPYRYKGEYLDPSTGIYKMGLRYYDPRQGRFTQQDILVSIGDPGNANRYAAFGDNPVSNADPTGASILGDVLQGLGVAASVAAIPLTGGASLAAGAAAIGFNFAGGVINGESADEAATGAAGEAVATVGSLGVGAAFGDTFGIGVDLTFNGLLTGS